MVAILRQVPPGVLSDMCRDRAVGRAVEEWERHADAFLE